MANIGKSTNHSKAHVTRPVSTGLGELLRSIKEDCGVGLGDLTVLSAQNDPFRLDTKSNHLNGAWFRDQMDRCGLLRRTNPIHNRGIHYAIVARGTAKLPSGFAL